MAKVKLCIPQSFDVEPGVDLTQNDANGEMLSGGAVANRVFYFQDAKGATSMADPFPVRIRVLDGRLGKKLWDMEPTDFVVPETYTIKEVVTAICLRAKGKRIDRLTLICHGLGEMVYGDVATSTGETVVLPGITSSDASTAVCRIYGGYGLHLGKELLTLENVSIFGRLKGWFDCTGVIEIFGCAAADTGPTSGGLSGDGPKLMIALAAATGASVRAAIQLQEVNQNLYYGTADRTAYVGPTYLFKPNGQKILDAACY